MRILYFTDIHGDIKKYMKLEKIGIEEKVDLVINGGDMLPNTDYEGKVDFIDRYFKRHLLFFDSKNIPYIYCFGNDDFLCLENYLIRATSNLANVYNVGFNLVKVKGFEFVGMNWVPDYPFRLKDYCHLDDVGSPIPAQYGGPIFTTLVEAGKQVARKADENRYLIEDWTEYVNLIPTIKDGLKSLPRPQTESNTIYLIHTPPYGTNLGNVEMFDVGSRSVMEFIMDRQPLMTLHGHIHHTYTDSGNWKVEMDKTVAIQPGQMPYDLTCVIIDVVGDKVNANIKRQAL